MIFSISLILNMQYRKKNNVILIKNEFDFPMKIVVYINRLKCIKNLAYILLLTWSPKF